ncbi:PEP-CTERM sorting domain-containing protein [Marinobacteraceae bacterium S3BR75-40.1]
MAKSTFPASIAAALMGFVSLAGSGAAFGTVILNAGTADCYAAVSPPNQGNVEASFQLECGTSPATMQYKANAGGGDEGTFLASYETTFNGSDPTNAVIGYISGLGNPFIDFDNVWVLAKDGNHDPSYYGWKISGWDGTEDISITAWDDRRGAISNVSIWAHSVSVPEPGTLSLLGASLFGVGFLRRRRAA